MGNDDSGKKKKKVEPNSSKGAVRFAGQTTGLTSPISIRPLSGPIDRIRLEPWSVGGSTSPIFKTILLGNDKIKDLEFCEHYVYAKAHKVKFSHAIHI